MRIKKTFVRKLVTFVSVLGLTIVAVVSVPSSKVYAESCGPNPIIYCGFTTNDQFITYLKNNKDTYPNTPHTDLQNVMNYYGLNSSEYERFRTSARIGTVNKDGRIVVDGQTVANNANTIGRTVWGGTYGKTVAINGKTYYSAPVSQRVSTSNTAKVMFDRDGNFEFAALTDCGNPVWGDKVATGVTCNMLNQTTVAGKANTYRYTTTATPKGNAKITKYVYDFGDGTALVTKLNGSDVVEHTFKPGTWNVKVTVYADVPGGQTITSSTTECNRSVTVAQPLVPYFECIALKGDMPVGMKYTFTAQAKFGNGAKFVGGEFDFGDGSKGAGTLQTANSTLSAIHEYKEAKKYSITATLTFQLPDGKTVTAPTCSWVVEPQSPPTPECKPGIPLGDSRCTTCPYDASLTSDDAKCLAPVVAAATLPNTGSGSVIALTLAALIGGFLFYRHKLFKKQIAAMHDAEIGMSPLPLADPLAMSEPLVDTPLETQIHRSTLRRRRQF